MKIFGLPIPFTGENRKALSSLPYGDSRGWYPIIHEPYPGAWQQNLAITADTAASFHADFACKTLIARDIAKLRIKLVEKDANDIWSETTNPAYSPVLRRPNDYQTRNQFWESWVLSKLSPRQHLCAEGARQPQRRHRAARARSDAGAAAGVRRRRRVLSRSVSDNLAGIGEIDRAGARDHPRPHELPVSSAGRHAAGVRHRGCPRCSGSTRRRRRRCCSRTPRRPAASSPRPARSAKISRQRFKAEWESRFSRDNLGRVAVLGGGAEIREDLDDQRRGPDGREPEMVGRGGLLASTMCRPTRSASARCRPTTTCRRSTSNTIRRRCRATSRRSRSCSTTRSASAGATGIGTEFDTDNLLRMDSIDAGHHHPRCGRRRRDVAERGPRQARPQAGRRRQVAVSAAAELFAGGAGQARRAGRSVRTAAPTPRRLRRTTTRPRDEDDEEETVAAFVEDLRRKSAERLSYA